MKTKKRNMMMSTISLDAIAFTDNPKEFEETINPEVPVKAELVLTLPSGRKITLDVPMIHEMDWMTFDEDGNEIFEEELAPTK